MLEILFINIFNDRFQRPAITMNVGYSSYSHLLKYEYIFDTLLTIQQPLVPSP
jgi:hypothetical protein